MFSLGSSQHYRGCGHRIVIPDETLRFRRFVRTQIVRPAKPNRLVPQLSLDAEWALRIASVDGILHQVTRIAEVRILASVAYHRYIRFGGFLLETAGQQPIVLKISHR